MIEKNATLLLPDISGFTEFMSTTELAHGSRAVNMLINAMIEAVEDEYEVLEIEGDAILMVRKGPAPTKKELMDVCLKIFNAFHFRREWMQHHAVCPCKACQEIVNLKLKFVAHHGPIDETKVGNFKTISGSDVIVAHRLLKNSVPSHEYLLFTEKLLEQSGGDYEGFEIDWTSSSEEYASLGKVDYRFALLDEARKNITPAPRPKDEYFRDATAYLEIPIALSFRDVYMVIMNIPGRSEWVPGLQKVEQDAPDVFVGSIHHCTFDNYEAVVSPLWMASSDEEILFAESSAIAEMGLSLVYEYLFKKLDEKESVFSCRMMNAGGLPVPEEINEMLSERMLQMAESLKSNCEK